MRFLLTHCKLLIPCVQKSDVLFILIPQFFVAASEIREFRLSGLLQLIQLKPQSVGLGIAIHASLSLLFQRYSNLIVFRIFQTILLQFLNHLFVLTLQCLVLSSFPVHQHFKLSYFICEFVHDFFVFFASNI